MGFKNPLEETIMAAYDPGSRVTSVTDRMGLTEAYTYDPHGNTLSVKAANGLVTRFSYDILDNLVRVTMPSELTTSYTYDVMGNMTSMTDTMKRTTTYTYDLEGNMTSIHDPSGRTERMGYDIGGRLTSCISNGGNKVSYDYDVLNSLVEKAYEDGDGNAVNEGVVYGYDVLGRRVSMMDRSGDSSYEYDGLGRITKVTTGSGEVTTYAYDGCDQLESITYPDGKRVRYEYDKNDNLTKVTDRTGAVTTYVYDAINRVTEIHRPNGVNTYNTYNARDQIVSMVNRCDECEWIVSRYDYTYDDRGFIVAEDAVESLYAYAWDDKHDGKHESWHDDLFPHGNKHINKHDKDGIYNFQIIETKRDFTYDDDGKLLTAAENEDRQGHYDYVFKYDDMGNRIFYSKARNGSVQESAEYTYNASNQMVKVREYDGKHYRNVEYSYDADGNRILEEEVKPDGNRKVEKSYEYSVENRLKAVRDAHDLLVAMAYDGDGNRIFQLNYNLHTDDDWKGNSGNGNGNNKDNTGSGNNGNGNGNKKSAVAAIADFFTGEEPEAGKLGAGVSQALAERLFSEEILGGLAEGLGIKEETVTAQEETGTDSSDTANADYGQTMTATPSNAAASYAGKNDNGNNGNGGNGNHYGWGNGNNGNGNGNNGNGNGNSSTGGTNDNNGNANGNTNNTGGSQNQSGILFPADGEVSELEQELIDMIKTTGKQKNYELVEYVNDVNRDHVEVLMELNINGIMDTAYSYGNERLTNERFTGWTGYYTYDPRGSVTGVTGIDGYIWQSYRYNAFGDITFGKPQYNNVYSYNAESFNPNMDAQYLRARYYSVKTAGFISEDSYLGDITDPLTLNRYNYVKSSPLNYIDPSGNQAISSYAANYQANDSGNNPIPSYAASHDSYGRGLPKLTSSVGFKTAVENAVNQVIDKGKEIKNYCENWVVGAKVTFYTKETEMTNMFMLMFGGDNITSDAEMNAHIAELINSIDNFDYVAYRDGTIDGEMLYIIQYMVAANNADKMLGGLVAGGGGVATGTIVTPEGYLVEVELSGGYAGVAENIGSMVAEGALAGVLAMNGQGGPNKGESDSKKNKIPDNDSTTGHIFRDAEGHIPDTPENRALLEEVANDSANFRGTDKYGNEWYTKTQSDGSQVWVESRNGNIFEGGVNNTPKPWNPDTGLKKP